MFSGASVEDEIWSNSWAWALPLIVLTVILHVIVLGFINARVVVALKRFRDGRRFMVVFVVVMAITTLMATLLHAVEAGIWATAYHRLGALSNFKAAMLYSLSALTTYGHAELFLAPHWRLMGALEALNGLLLFGLTTAFLYAHVQRVWPIEATARAARELDVARDSDSSRKR
jgi:MFS superfamily sulfate permease-like transporter